MGAIKGVLCIRNKWSNTRGSVTSAKGMEPAGESSVDQHRHSPKPGCLTRAFAHLHYCSIKGYFSGEKGGRFKNASVACVRPRQPGTALPVRGSSAPAALAGAALADGLWDHLPAPVPAAEAANVSGGRGEAGAGNRWAAWVSGAPLIHRE